jgi:hypothetical protein
MKTLGWVHQQSQWAANGLLFSRVQGRGGNGVHVGGRYARRGGYTCSYQMNLPGIVAGKNRALVIKMVRRSRIKAEAFGHLFIMAALVLRFFSGREVHWGGAIIAAVGAGGVARHVGSRWGYLGSGQVGPIWAAREVGMGSYLVVEFHT